MLSGLELHDWPFIIWQNPSSDLSTITVESYNWLPAGKCAMTSMLTPISFRRNEWLICLLLMLSTVHCVRSIFLVNVSRLDLFAYGQGVDEMPFQGRVLMMPLVRWSHQSSSMKHIASFFDASLVKTPHMQNPPEHVTPEKMVCILSGLLATLMVTAYCIWFGQRRFGQVWWLPATLTLAILYVTYAARYEEQFWYPYDLPHFALFGIAAACILDNMWLAAFLLFLIDVPMRETSIYLLPVLLAVGYSRNKWRQALVWGACMALIWLPVRLIIAHHFASNRSDVGIHWHGIAVSIANPLHWPQIASALGFLFLPLCFGFKYLDRDQRYFAYAAIPGMVVTLLFGVWYETRIWDEWMIPAAILLTCQAVARYKRAFSERRAALSAVEVAREYEAVAS